VRHLNRIDYPPPAVIVAFKERLEPPRLRTSQRIRIIEGRMSEQNTGRAGRRSGWSWWYLLLVVQFVFLLWVPSYNRVEPSWGGMPFFYWYQLVWVFISAILTAIVYFAIDE
jgi:hypothetical protein